MRVFDNVNVLLSMLNTMQLYICKKITFTNKESGRYINFICLRVICLRKRNFAD